MSADYWLNRWKNNDIGFHESRVNPYLDRYFTNLKIPQNGRVFVPLCGKTNDIAWLLEQNIQVVGVELCESAIKQLFGSLNVTPTVTVHDKFKLYSADNLAIWVGDIFALTANLLGSVDVIYDRGSLVALPFTLRKKYSRHVVMITQKAPQLLICCVYDQSKRDGTPYSISAQEVFDHYHHAYSLQLIRCEAIANGVKGVVPANIVVWQLNKKD
ncbi:MAG: thiopurine S-methyltransferase [Pseudoalteromonas rhizosphaerae]|jgi:thiopurine S-methyltransferase|uniref:Thiopurine S-methyltransferase n=1 Tax=Pseudoalteromonas neustonica TaxID=1840331 RepID=A0ABY3FCE3_9GAMM|nr:MULTISPECIES: thiopurine S-methyltransferase [Pseudoalteromonas]MBB1300897.1 thiopurine S-methyltransferase [Pseudoalteromonas sp. SR44-8]MBB1398251.1 thiopurine S-methyltransferase [Pseudoalteromonas sp. SG44-8]TVU82632.1 thiopurine S-methyltransferase [Pseudoalteromonas neustonica]